MQRPAPGAVMSLMRLFSRPCPVHDGPPPPLKIAELEESTGINPNAVAELRRTASFMDAYNDPDLADCGNRRCRQRRGLPS
jgi:hypothetical protein